MTVFPLTSFPWKAFLGVSAITVVLPLAVIAGVLFSAQAMPNWALIFVLSVSIGFMLSVTLGLSAFLVYVLTRNEVSIRDGSVHIKAGFFHQRVKLPEIGAPRVVDLRAERDMAPDTRRNGVRLPGFQVGWFTLKNRARAFVLLTGRERVVHVPTTKGFSLLLSLKEPELFLEQLHAPT
jgi:hypothetical protein